VIVKKVAMPRFRRAHASSTRLTEVVNRILTRAFGPGGAFGVFIIDRRCILTSISTTHFRAMQARNPDAFIGTYDKDIRIADLLDDLSAYFSDEAVNDVA
jgi:hypothetical protein